MGYIYVLSNPSMPGLRKIGKTTTSPNQRMVELHSTGVPTPFVLEHSFEVSDCDTCERDAHQALASYRVASNREFFRASQGTILKLLVPVVEAYALDEPQPEYDDAWVEELWAQKDAIEAMRLELQEMTRQERRTDPRLDLPNWSYSMGAGRMLLKWQTLSVPADGCSDLEYGYDNHCAYCEKQLKFGAPFFEGRSWSAGEECVCDDCYPRHVREVNEYRAKMGWEPASW